MIIILQLIWLFLPAGIANMAAALSAKILPKWSQPIDFGRNFRGQRIFGDHKTWRGLIFGTICGGLIFLLQKYLCNNYLCFQQIDIVDYKQLNIFFGLAVGFGALCGDLIKSFFKRRVNIPAGKSWFPFDQIDWVIGAVGLSFFFLNLSWMQIIITLFLGVVIHLLTKVVAYLLNVEKQWL